MQIYLHAVQVFLSKGLKKGFINPYLLILHPTQKVIILL